MLLFLNCMQIENYEISTVLILDHCCTGWKLCVLILYHLNDLPPCVLGLHRFFFFYCSNYATSCSISKTPEIKK